MVGDLGLRWSNRGMEKSKIAQADRARVVIGPGRYQASVAIGPASSSDPGRYQASVAIGPGSV